MPATFKRSLLVECQCLARAQQGLEGSGKTTPGSVEPPHNWSVMEEEEGALPRGDLLGAVALQSLMSRLPP